MKKHFPPMFNCLGTGFIICILIYWFLISSIVIPTMIPLVAHGLWTNVNAISWIESVCCAVNGIVLILVMKEYLTDSFFDIQISFKSYIAPVAVTVFMMLIAVAASFIPATVLFGNPYLVYDVFPIPGTVTTMTPGYLVVSNPIVGTLCMALLSPFAVCGIYYATGFAPLCCRKPWLGYLNVAILLLIGAGIEIFWRSDVFYSMAGYLLRLPVHMIACWSYQKTDNVWTPIFSLGILNLLVSVVFALFLNIV